MGGETKQKPFDLEERAFRFAQDVRRFVARLPKTLANGEDARQLVRASGSVGANYIEANESLSRKDFVLRAKICRKEAKEAAYWLRLLATGMQVELESQRKTLVQEAMELTSILGCMVRRVEKSLK